MAAIDVGTNSFHLVVAKVDPVHGRFRIIGREKEMVRLGVGLEENGYLSSEAIERGLIVLKRFGRIAEGANAAIRAIATSAVREASNQQEFIRRVKLETGIRIEIASGDEEARLIYLGVLQALPFYDRRILLIDIGGGSTEFLIGEKRQIHFSHSLKIGAIRLTQKFFRHEIIKKSEIKECERYVNGMLNPMFRAIRKAGFDVAVGTSGTILNLAKMIRVAEGDEILARMNNYTFSYDSVMEIVEKILSRPDPQKRARLPGLDSARVDIVVAGALILKKVFEVLKIRDMTVSEFALREGILLDTMEKKIRKGDFHDLGNIRYQSVLHLAENYHYEKGHSEHVAALALKIFDQTKRLHQLDKVEREYLEASALLHEVGFFISREQHHHHSYYLIRNSELLGFTENEKEIIANIARYHRKSHPKLKHEGFSRLNNEEQEVVTKLAAILRVADGLDRTHSQAVQDIICKKSGSTVHFVLHRHDSSPVDLEIWGAENKKQLFEEIFGVKVSFMMK